MLNSIFKKEMKKVNISIFNVPFLSFETFYTNNILEPKNDILYIWILMRDFIYI